MASDRNVITPEEFEYFKHMLDPVNFAETYCCNGIFMKSLRPFQKEILRCKDKRVVLRIGRRSGKTHTMAVKALTAAMTNKHYRVAIITPTQMQSEVIYEMILNKILIPSDALRTSIEGKAKKSPPEIPFTNGSRIRFYTAGTRTGSGAINVRGQGADLIILDETDYLNEADLESILALLIEHKDIEIWSSSTPTGKRGHFYNWCTKENKNLHKDGDWREFHFTSAQAIPDWNDDTEKFMRKNYTGDGYAREILAEFGHEMSGVFNKFKVDLMEQYGSGMYEYSALIHPTYGYMQKPRTDARRTIGVDWDKYGAPTQIVVLEEYADIYRVACRVQIEKSQFTYTNAVNKLIELNEIWNPEYIYIDSGAGEFQIETLHKHGIDHQETGLHKKCKRISFGSKTDWFDPWTKMIDRKDTKPLMVNLLSRSFEEEKILLNEHDEEMYSQLVNYCVEKISATGRPIYTSENEHIVDALALAHFAMLENFTEENKVKSVSYYNFTPRDEVKEERQSSGYKYRSRDDFNRDKVNPYFYDTDNQYRRGTNVKAVVKRGIKNSVGKRKVVRI